MNENKRNLYYYIETFGCQMNVRDSETIAGILLENGYAGPCGKEDADFILYNTCCVRDHAEKRVFGNIGALREIKEQKPGLIIAVCGCMMQQKEVASRLFRRFPFVDLVFGTNMLPHLPEYLAEATLGNRVLAVEKDAVEVFEGLPVMRGSGINAFVNINFGCNNFCTYCIVPYVRGRERSRKPAHILAEVTELVKQGYSEITLLGQNVNSYGFDLPDADFSSLLRRVAKTEGLERLRFMTSHPKDLTDGLIAAIAETPNVCRHVHLPMQSGSDRILLRMNRRYDRAQYFSIVEKLRSAMDDVELTTDVIVGFPGETEEDFAQTLDAVERIGFASAFTFQYSPRKGTAAATMPDQVPEAVKRDRLMRLNALQERKSLENNQKYVGHLGLIHVEGCDTRGEPMCFGKYPNFKMVYFPGKPEWVGRYLPVRATAPRANSLIGEVEETH